MFSYSRAEQSAILAPLQLADGVTESDVIIRITEAAGRAIDMAREAKAAPLATAVQGDLANLGAAASQLSDLLGRVADDAGPWSRTFRNALERRVGPFAAARLCGDRAASRRFLADLQDIEHAAREAHAVLDPAAYERNGVLPVVFVDGVRMRPAGSRNKGRYPNSAMGQFGIWLAIIYYRATGMEPTYSQDRGVYGPYVDYFRAAVVPTGVKDPKAGVDHFVKLSRREFREWKSFVDSAPLGSQIRRIAEFGSIDG